MLGLEGMFLILLSGLCFFCHVFALDVGVYNFFAVGILVLFQNLLLLFFTFVVMYFTPQGPQITATCLRLTLLSKSNKAGYANQSSLER